jgi:hypothetical protein
MHVVLERNPADDDVDVERPESPLLPPRTGRYRTSVDDGCGYGSNDDCYYDYNSTSSLHCAIENDKFRCKLERPYV